MSYQYNSIPFVFSERKGKLFMFMVSLITDACDILRSNKKQ